VGQPLEKLREDLDSLSGSISSQARSIALGIVALVWALITGSDVSKLNLSSGDRQDLIWPALLAILSLLFDYLQYVVGYWNTLSVYSKAETANKKEAVFNKKGFWYRARYIFFVLKQIAVIVASGWMSMLLLRIVLR